MNILKDNVYPQHKTNFHLIPGRLRVGIPSLLHDQNLAFQIAHQLATFPGVKMCYANPITGQALVNFDPFKTDLKLLLSWISCLNGQSHGINSPAPRPPKTVGSYPLKQPGPQKQAPPLPVPQKPVPWHVLEGPGALLFLNSSIKTGLSHRAAQNRLAKFGLNELKEKRKTSFWQVALKSLNGFMIKLLLAAGGVSFLVGEITDAAIIVAIVAIQALVEAAQSCRAEKSLDNLKKLSAPLTTVLREGKRLRIPSKELVPGDVLHLGAGDLVPADALVIKAVNLTTNEACLTGESIPVVKDNRKRTDPETPVAEQVNMLFSGTSIIGGQALALVVTTGMRTELGRIAQLLNDIQDEQTNLQKQIDHLGKKITHLVVGSVGTIAVINLLRGLPIIEVFRSGISLAVGAVPEGLPAIFTVALSTGVQRMAKRNALVRNISAVETLGSATVICTDKTGTLTKNEMTVKELYVEQTFYQVTGDGYRPDGQILPQKNDRPEGIGIPPAVIKTLKAAVLCNNAGLKVGPGKKWTVVGDPTEGALLTAAAKAGLWWQDLRRKYCRHQEIAFDAQRRLMTVVCQEPDGEYGIYVKGAPEAVLNYSSFMIGEQQAEVLDLKTRQKILAANETMAGKALRILAVAYKKLSPGADLKKMDLESGLIFCGLVGMADVPRQGVREAIQKCHTAGVKVIMITGDHQKTAEAVATELGILRRGKSITGKELEQISDAEFRKQVRNITVYSRTTPDQKLRIVRALKACGQIVAMTGDGVNDAPAVKEANIGIAMGRTGTDVTRGVAGMVLSDDNFATIVSGIEEGRTVGMNLTKSVHYILSGNLSQLLAVFITAASGLPAPLLPAQILWVNLVTESLPAISFTADPPGQNYMSQPPFHPQKRFLVDQGRAILRKSIILGLTAFGLYAAGLTWGGWSLTRARTMVFSQLVINRVFSLLHERKTKEREAPDTRGNPLIVPAAAFSTSLLAATMYLPFMRPLFATVPLGLADWILLTANALIVNKIDFSLENRSKNKQNLKTVRPSPEIGGNMIKARGSLAFPREKGTNLIRP